MISIISQFWFPQDLAYEEQVKHCGKDFSSLDYDQVCNCAFLSHYAHTL